MKSMTFVNERNGEQVVCDDVRAVQVIDGIDYLIVHKQDNPRPFMMRKDALKKVNGVGSVMAARLSVKQSGRVRFPTSPQLNYDTKLSCCVIGIVPSSD